MMLGAKVYPSLKMRKSFTLKAPHWLLFTSKIILILAISRFFMVKTSLHVVFMAHVTDHVNAIMPRSENATDHRWSIAWVKFILWIFGLLRKWLSSTMIAADLTTSNINWPNISERYHITFHQRWFLGRQRSAINTIFDSSLFELTLKLLKLRFRPRMLIVCVYLSTTTYNICWAV